MDDAELRTLVDWARAWDVLPPATNRQIANLRQHQAKLHQDPDIPGAQHMLVVLDVLLDVPGHMTDLEIRLWSNVRIVDDDDSCWEFKGYRMPTEGYGVLSVSGELSKNRKSLHAHRVGYILANNLTETGVPEGIVVRHTCDNPPCCRPNHLIPGTQSDNIRDRFERGRTRGKVNQRGEANDSAVLTDHIVLEARRRFRAGENASQLAEAFNVAIGTIQGALHGTTWSHLNEIEPPTKGLRPSGSFLTEDDVRFIRAQYAAVANPTLKRDLAARQVMADMAEKFGVGIPNIYAIVKRKSWKHVE